jgi:hypothetical protein
VTVAVLADAERDEENPGDEAHRPADPDALEDGDWLVDLR